jgi:hypothetical protein
MNLSLKKNDIINRFKELCKPGLYTLEELDEITSKGAMLIAEYIDADILEQMLNMNTSCNKFLKK